MLPGQRSNRAACARHAATLPSLSLYVPAARARRAGRPERCDAFEFRLNLLEAEHRAAAALRLRFAQSFNLVFVLTVSRAVRAKASSFDCVASSCDEVDPILSTTTFCTTGHVNIVSTWLIAAFMPAHSLCMRLVAGIRAADAFSARCPTICFCMRCCGV